eukprot:CAMPEP_0203840452 /NCGR_PEP_ID=MMETSP0359-20131031/787_1 /ASSEMBLY_ACC=CAM_ASM_000338 /TAXON_ID=268821 /ORGANISM="Scrippsiella Hangoei, Strain SHTV-5" /LENGTH=66 /DNA_ID=CAMNT_0050754667 /DNA_START=289 /DNA_END=489 /DNA_ORIENTATION=-
MAAAPQAMQQVAGKASSVATGIAATALQRATSLTPVGRRSMTDRGDAEQPEGRAEPEQAQHPENGV